MIQSKTQYDAVMQQINTIMQKGSKTITTEEEAVLRVLSESAQAFEEQYYQIKGPVTVGSLLELYMYEHALNQRELAALLGISPTKLSFLINGKRRPDVDLLKSLHRLLRLDAAVLLETA